MTGGLIASLENLISHIPRLSGHDFITSSSIDATLLTKSTNLVVTEVANRVVPEMWIAKRQPPELREFLQIQYIPERAHLG